MDELEDRLRRYRPVGPPSSLRARVVATDVSSARRRWVWVPSAVAAAAAFTFYVLAASARRDLSQELTRIDPRREAVVRALASDLGGDEQATEVAASLIDLNEATAAAVGAIPGSAPDLESGPGVR